MKPNTSYGIRTPGDDELRTAFGSLAHCVRVTGGDLHTILFYLNNPDRIDAAPEVAPQPGEYARSLAESALVESAAQAWESVEKPTIKATSQSLGVCRQVARRALVTAGKVPA